MIYINLALRNFVVVVRVVLVMVVLVLVVVVMVVVVVLVVFALACLSFLTLNQDPQTVLHFFRQTGKQIPIHMICWQRSLHPTTTRIFVEIITRVSGFIHVSSHCVALLIALR